jgi:hypothetical protein
MGHAEKKMSFFLRNDRTKVGVTVILFCAWWTVTAGQAQDMTPRAYIISPLGFQAVTLSYSYNDGPVFTDPTVPIEDFKGSFHLQSAGFYHAYSLFGRSSNITFVLPYAVGNFQGTATGPENQIYRSGMADARLRFSINLVGGRAMSLKEFMSWRQKFLLGASLMVSAPTGQYDPARVINPGTNRWAFKPELGLSRRWGNWIGDAYGGIWFFTANDEFYPGLSRRSQKPIYIGEGHLGYNLKPALWFSLDGNLWAGGRSKVDGEENYDRQKNSRLGATLSVPISRHQSLKFSINTGAYVTIGGDYTTITVAWQYSWIRAKK